MTPTPQQIRSETYKLDRAADALADLDYAPLSESVVTIRDLSKKLNKLANNLTPTAPHKLKLGFVANGDEVKLVKQIGATYARVQGWPGGAQEIASKGAFSQGIEVAIRIAREYKPDGTSKALEPLTAEVLRGAMMVKISPDLVIYKQHGVKTIILGNEPDGNRGGKPRYWTGEVGRFGTDWAQYIAPLVRAAGMRVGFGLPVFASNTREFLLDLVRSGAYQPGDFLAVNIYGVSAVDHHGRLDAHIAAIRAAIPDFDFKNLEVSEAGLQRAGPADAWIAEFETALDTYRAKKFPGAISIYRIDENSEAPFAPFKDGQPTPTLDRWKAMQAA